jgi:hypothetical protein
MIISLPLIAHRNGSLHHTADGHAFDDHLLPEERLIDEHLACMHGCVDAAGLYGAFVHVERFHHDEEHQGHKVAALILPD